LPGKVTIGSADIDKYLLGQNDDRS